MTTIAWDGKTLAADRLCVVGGNLKRTITKLFNCGDYVFGGSGSLGDVMRSVDWLRDGAPMPNNIGAHSADESGQIGIAVYRDGAPFVVVLEMTHLRLLPLEDPFYAVGSGRDFAIAAMALGKDAADAVELTARFDVWTGRGVNLMRCRDSKWPLPISQKEVVQYADG
jgi:hypothetical protein